MAQGTVHTDNPVELVVFDFDGTSITGNSPVLLVRYLTFKGKIAPTVLLRILSWAVAYKCRLPQNEAWVRGLVFRSFAGQPCEQVDQFLMDFYDSHLEKRFRPAAIAEMQRHVDAGRVVMIVSATFEPIILRAIESKPFQFQVSTRMAKLPDGTYSCEVEGEPVEGAEKLAAVKRFANERYGAGNWKLAYAYGDHHSDRTLLMAAEHPHAVTPDQPLERTAKKRGWPILNWE